MPSEERFLAHFATRDWDAMGHDFADDYYCDDRRRVVNAGVRHGRDAAIEDLRVLGEIGLATNITSDIIATRGERLFVIRARWLGPDERPEDLYTELLNVIEIDPEERIAAQVMFDPDDIDAAIEELDARYLAGEAAACTQTWSVVAEAYAAFNRHDLPAANWVTVDRRRATPFESSTMTEILRAIWDLTPDLKIHIEAVHRLDSFGAVITHTQSGSSPEGFDAEWRMIQLLIVEGDRLTGCEIFDEADLDAALARFDELQPAIAATRKCGKPSDGTVPSAFRGSSDWDAIAGMLAADLYSDDRRPVVGGGSQARSGCIDRRLAGSRRRRDHECDVRCHSHPWRASRPQPMPDTRAAVGNPTRSTSTSYSVVEIDTEDRITAFIAFDANDIDAAFEELDARYLAGEAAAYAHTWSVITRFNAGFNRHELPRRRGLGHHRPPATHYGRHERY